MNTMLYAEITENPEIPTGNNAQVRSIRREVNNAWLAGIIEGEGSFQFVNHCGVNSDDVHLRAQVHVYNSDVRMVRKISEIYLENGIRFHYYLQNNKHYNNTSCGVRITASGYRNMKKLLDLIMPYLVCKLDQAMLMREYIESRLQPRIRDERGWLIVDEENRKKSQWYFAEMRRLKTPPINPSTTTRKASTILGW